MYKPASAFAYCHEKYVCKKIESGAGTVTIAAADWAKSCGFQKLKFFGADFSYNFGKPYTKGTYLEKQFFSKSNRLISAEEKHIALMFRTELEKYKDKKILSQQKF